MEKEPIIFYNGDENGIVVEKSDYQHSLFKDQYRKAFDVFHRIWNAQKPMIKIEKDEGKDAYHGMDNRFSNIISFCGDRGEGKSSCMSSFTAMLTEQDARNAAVDSKLVANDYVAWENIELIEFIDPSFFDEQHNVLELLLGRMYANVSEINSQRTDYESQLYNIRQLREQFQKVKTSLAVLHKKDENNLFENLEELDELAAGIRLKKELDELFRLYLKFTQKERLLICIDDMDLNMSQGYKMAELVRKYLIGKYCVLLVSVNLAQLVDVITIAMRKELGEGNVSMEYCQQMAQKYVTKLIPQGNRIYMPTGESLYERESYFLENRQAEKDEREKMTVKERVVQLIFQKTGYVFYNINGVSPIVPNNLRSLRHLTAALLNLPDYKDDKGNDREEGRIAFKKYFWGTWVPQHLSKEDQQFANQLSDYSDSSSLNSFVIEYFADRVETKKLTPSAENQFYKLYNAIIKKENIAVNSSYGDVMYVLWLIGRITDDIEIHQLIFFIKTVYSMRLYATYNIVTSGNGENIYPPKREDSNVAIHKSDRYYVHVNDLQRLVNGSYFSYPGTSIFPAERITNKITAPRDKRIISFKAVRNYLQTFYAEIGKNTQVDLTRLQICEFLALCICRTTSSKDVDSDNTEKGLNRTYMTPTYIGRFSDTANFAVFDFLQPFYSLCNIEYAYRRFDSIFTGNEKELEKGEDPKVSLYNIALENENSLLSRLLHVVEEENPILEDSTNTSEAKGEQSERSENSNDENLWAKKHRLVSDAIIRNSDVQTAIFDVLIQSREVHKVSKFNDVLRLAYQDIQNLGITLYPIIKSQKERKADDFNPSWLTFEFLSVLVEFLENVNEKEFNRVMSVPDNLKMADARDKFNAEMASTLLKLKYPADSSNLVEKILKVSKFKSLQKVAFENSLKHVFVNEKYTLAEVNNLHLTILGAYLTIWELMDKK